MRLDLTAKGRAPTAHSTMQSRSGSCREYGDDAKVAEAASGSSSGASTASSAWWLFECDAAAAQDTAGRQQSPALTRRIAVNASVMTAAARLGRMRTFCRANCRLSIGGCHEPVDKDTISTQLRRALPMGVSEVQEICVHPRPNASPRVRANSLLSLQGSGSEHHDLCH